jgi:hypothetical protein
MRLFIHIVVCLFVSLYKRVIICFVLKAERRSKESSVELLSLVLVVNKVGKR